MNEVYIFDDAGINCKYVHELIDPFSMKVYGLFCEKHDQLLCADTDVGCIDREAIEC